MQNKDMPLTELDLKRLEIQAQKVAETKEAEEDATEDKDQ
jgi:hypothetical protein